MRNRKKRIFSFLTSVVLMLSMVGTNLTAYAENEPFQPTNEYVFAYGDEDVDALSPYAYFSPFVPQLTYDGTDQDGYSILFRLKNTYNGNIYRNAYCTDLPVADADGIYYRPLNLSDSTYASAHANKLRAVVLNSYPQKSLDTLIHESGIEGLSKYEAITGTQLAVWKAAHGDIVQIKDFLYRSHSYGATISEDTLLGKEDNAKNAYVAYENGDKAYKAGVKSRIEALYNYLMALPEQKPTAEIISAASFVKRDKKPALEKNDDGTYDITVNVTVNIPAGSNVTLTAYMDVPSNENGSSAESGYSYYVRTGTLTAGKNECILKIQNVPSQYKDKTVVLSLDGTQEIKDEDVDVFLLDSEGIRGRSQSMIAPFSGTFPVHAEVKAEPDRVLELTKKDSSDKESPLANISFEVYYVGTIEDFTSGKLGIGEKPTADDLKQFAKTNKLVGTITTDSQGEGSLNLSTEDGVYLVKELPNDLVEDSVAFFVTLPDYSRPDTDGNPSYTITAVPKNTTIGEKIEIEKDVTDLDNEHDTYDIGKEHTWIIQSSIPDNIGTGQEYTVSDTLDERLDLVSVDKVTLASDNGTFGDSSLESYEEDKEETPKDSESNVLEKDKDYTVTIGKTTDEKQDTFKVSLTKSGMKKAATAKKNETSPCNELRIYFTAKINEKAGMGEEIPNQADVKYTNHVGKTYTKESDKPEVHMGGVQILKVDSKDNTKVLAGATFEVYRKATEAEIKENLTGIETIKVDNNEIKVMPVSFYNSKPDVDAEGKYTVAGTTAQSFTTGADGKGYIYGLAYGEYYLVETKAPDGYDILVSPVKIEINATSHLEKNAVKVENTSGVLLPITGGMGTTIFTLSGLLMTGMAGFLLLKRKKTV